MKQIIFCSLSLLFVTACSLFEQKKDAKTAQETALNTIQEPTYDTLSSLSLVETPKVKSMKPKVPPKIDKPSPSKQSVAVTPTASKQSVAVTPSPSKTSVAGVPQPKATPKTTPKAAPIPIVPKGKVTPSVAATDKKIPVQVTAKGQGEIPQPYNSALNFNSQMLTAVNAMRIRGYNCGGEMMPAVQPLVWNTKLEKAAIVHVADMDRNNNFSHAGTDGSLPDDRIKAAGYEWERVGENIGRGYKDVASAVIGWKESVNHCKQMMSPEVTQFGAAKKGNYWCQTFAKPLQ